MSQPTESSRKKLRNLLDELGQKNNLLPYQRKLLEETRRKKLYVIFPKKPNFWQKRKIAAQTREKLELNSNPFAMFTAEKTTEQSSMRKTMTLLQKNATRKTEMTSGYLGERSDDERKNRIGLL